MSNGHDSAIWYSSDVHDHGFDRAEILHPDVFWGEAKSGHANPSGIVLEEYDAAQVTGRAEPLVGVRLVT